MPCEDRAPWIHVILFSLSMTQCAGDELNADRSGKVVKVSGQNVDVSKSVLVVESCVCHKESHHQLMTDVMVLCL